ncbi:MAG: leucine-rich repeat domain-containing protein [Bacteroidota bacterium]|nr:leucine-rich repeat domain-containing protein [Bacteroidota bacterium]
MLYHPDKGQYHRNKIECFYEAGNNEMLGQFSHILVAIELSDKIEIKEKELEIDFEPEYVWDDNVEGNGYHTIFEEGELIFEEGFENCEDYEKTFYNAVKIRMYGNIDMNFPFYYLEDFDEVEMSDSGIEFLDGIKHCKHARNINLNGNSISDITDLLGLKRIEELYLADNQISYIDILSRLYNLKKLDISNNNIDDISPLNELPNLQYLNVIGNHIPNQQIEKLKDLGVIVVC